jgi:hypothetical protein
LAKPFSGLDPYDSPGVDRKAASAEELKLCREMHVWIRYVLISLGAFRSGSQAPTQVEPPAWRIDANAVKHHLEMETRVPTQEG